MVHWVKDLVLLQLCHRFQLQLEFDPWPRKFHMSWVRQKKKKKKKGIYWLTKEIKSEVLGRTGSRALNPTGIPQFLHISALLPLHWLHSWADPPERMDTGSSKHSAQHPSHASVINSETSLKRCSSFPIFPIESWSPASLNNQSTVAE